MGLIASVPGGHLVQPDVYDGAQGRSHPIPHHDSAHDHDDPRHRCYCLQRWHAPVLAHDHC
jgi:hypothetical protein